MCRCVCENDLCGELITRLTEYPKLTTALSSLPPKLIRLTEGADPHEVKPEERDLADRVSMVKSRLAKATFTSQGDAKLVPEL